MQLLMVEDLDADVQKKTNAIWQALSCNFQTVVYNLFSCNLVSPWSHSVWNEVHF